MFFPIFFRMAIRREKALVKFVCQMAYRDALEAQMNALEQSKQSLKSERVKRMINRELSRLRGEFNSVQAQLESMQGRLLPITRTNITEEVKIDPNVSLCGSEAFGHCTKCSTAEPSDCDNN